MRARVARLFSFPLLAKELTEAAARRRTYITRVLYALLLYALFALMMPRWLWQPGTSPLQAMGAGRQLFEQLIVLQVAGIALFLPALMCGRIAQEKERESLVLLLLTELRPWQIVLQKYAGGLVPMLTFLLLGMPLAAIAYAFGGVTNGKLFGYLFALIVAALQVGAIALFCSAWCRTTVGAFLATYFLGVLFYAGPPVASEIVDEIAPLFHFQNWRPSDDLVLALIPFVGVEETLSALENVRTAGAAARPGASSYSRLYEALGKLLPAVLSVPFFLVLTRFVLVRRAFTPPSNFFLNIFRFFDRIMKRSNRFVGNVMLIREREDLPGDQPIYWRETARRALGKIHYLVRILVGVEILTVFLCGIFASIDYGGHSESLSVLLSFLMAIAVIALSAQAANTIVSERVQQTLEVLLTTPLSGRAIVQQKARALGRLACVAAVPLLTVFGTECWLEAGMRPSLGRAGWDEGDGWLAYAVCAVSMVAIYLPMIVWLSLWIGLRVRTRFRAIVTALVTLVLWCGLPIFVFVVSISPSGITPGDTFTRWMKSITLLSPIMVGMLNEEGDLHEFPWEIGSPWPVIAVNALFYGTITLIIRRHALANADRWLRR